jgi:hypothetical protein
MKKKQRRQEKRKRETAAPNASRKAACDRGELEEQLKIGKKLMQEYRETLKALAKM